MATPPAVARVMEIITVIAIAGILVLSVGGLTLAVLKLVRTFGSYESVTAEVKALKLEVAEIKKQLPAKEKSA